MNSTQVIVVDKDLLQTYADLEKEFSKWAKDNLLSNGKQSNDELFALYNKLFPKLVIHKVKDLSENIKQELFKNIETDFKGQYEKDVQKSLLEKFKKDLEEKLKKTVYEDLHKKLRDEVSDKYTDQYKKELYDELYTQIDSLNKNLMSLDISKYTEKTLDKKIEDIEKHIKTLKESMKSQNGYYSEISKLVNIDKEYCKNRIELFEYDSESNSDNMEYGNSSGNFKIYYEYRNCSGELTDVTINYEYEEYGRYVDCDDNENIELNVDGCKENTICDYELSPGEFFIEEDNFSDVDLENDPRKIAFMILEKYEGDYKDLTC